MVVGSLSGLGVSPGSEDTGGDLEEEEDETAPPAVGPERGPR